MCALGEARIAREGDTFREESVARDELEALVAGLEFPISKRALSEAMRQMRVPDSTLGLVERLPDDVYQSHAALMADFERALRTGS